MWCEVVNLGLFQFQSADFQKWCVRPSMFFHLAVFVPWFFISWNNKKKRGQQVQTRISACINMFLFSGPSLLVGWLFAPSLCGSPFDVFFHSCKLHLFLVCFDVYNFVFPLCFSLIRVFTSVLFFSNSRVLTVSFLNFVFFLLVVCRLCVDLIVFMSAVGLVCFLRLCVACVCVNFSLIWESVKLSSFVIVYMFPIEFNMCVAVSVCAVFFLFVPLTRVL